MFETIALTTGLDDFSVLQIITIAGICSFIVSQRLDGWMGMVVSTLGLYGAALGANLLARKYGAIVTANKQIDGVLFSVAGLVTAIIGLLLARMLLSRLFGVATVSVHELRHQEALRAMDRTLR